MTEVAISLKNISKCFKRYRHPVDRLKEMLLPGCTLADEFWALRDINVEVEKGQTLGIVGRNGSGKSTLLQIIVGTLTPTAGEIHVNGRISALLELGSGFNPEFTGRQNVFFNGQLLGLKHQEIEAKFDEIAAFADIGDFMDQPVKTYSSGMFVRLGFAVAISVNPDILVVDEALSVGDEAFQRKCLSRIQLIQDQGGTILFVSHAASTVVELCNSAILMDRGELILYSSPKFVVSKYQKLIYALPNKIESIREEITDLRKKDYHPVLNEYQDWEENSQGSNQSQLNANGHLEFEEIYVPDMVPSNTIYYPSLGAEIINPRITTLDGKQVNHLIGRRDYFYTYTVSFWKSTCKVRFGMLIKTITGIELGGASLYGNSKLIEVVEPGQIFEVKFKFQCLLNPGVYFLNAGVTGLVDDHITYLARCIDIAMFRVQPCSKSYGTAIVDLLVEPSVSLQERVNQESSSAS